ncbi:armadillo-type protein [Armillaria nabsnona]|nr:armadillo-type protein [Armillaria nabsnona]
MASSLARQLAQGASLNSALLVDRSRRKAGESYLFTGGEADLHDLESIHALGTNGFLQLVSITPALSKFEGPLFSDASKETDRTLLPAEALAKLDETIGAFLVQLGPYLMEAPTGKIIEWLVRRFRINEFNVESVLSLFLPYHESPHFAKMVTILHIRPNSTWSFLIPFKKAAQSVPRMALVKEMLRNSDVSRFIANLLPAAIKGGYSHRSLLAFNAATLHDYMLHSKVLDDGTLAYLLPALLEPLQHPSEFPTKDTILGSYILLSTLSHKCSFTTAAQKAIVTAMSSCANLVSSKQFVSAVVSVCEGQDEMDDLPDGVVKTILSLPNISIQVGEALGWAGTEKFLNPLLSGLTQQLDEDTAFGLLETILMSSNTPDIIVGRLSEHLIKLAVSETESSNTILVARRLLSHIHQRYPAILHSVSEEMAQDDEELKTSLDNLVMSLSMNQTYSTTTGTSSKDDNNDTILASTSADSKIRLIAVKDLIKRHLSGSLTSEQKALLSSALVARTQDSDQRVLEALYEQHEVILPALIKDSETYINQLSTLFSSTKPKRPILKTHLNFLTRHFYQKVEVGTQEKLFHKIVFPLMLYSKPRQLTVELLWDILEENTPKSGAGHYELLNGCIDLWTSTKAKDSSDGVDKMATFNIQVAARMAENILSSNNFSHHLDELMVKFNDSNAYVRIFAYMVARSLLRRLSGSHQIDAAHKALRALDLEQLSKVEDPSSGSEDPLEYLDDDRIGKSVVSKPNSKNTAYWLQMSIITICAGVSSPEGILVNWLSTRPVQGTSDDRDHRYVTLMRSIYGLANSSSSNIAMHMLRTLFMNIADEALAFLTGVWADCDDEDLAVVAFGHTIALLKAHMSGDESVDFQTIVPSLLVSLQSPHLEIRKAALQCVGLLAKGAEKKYARVYAFDTIYGGSTVNLQYLDQDDLKRYLAAIAEHEEHLLHDPAFLSIFHLEHLQRLKSDKRKHAQYKYRILCYLASHINVSPSPHSQLCLLRSISSISDEDKAAILLPSVKLIAEDTQIKDIYGSTLEEFTSLLVSVFDASSAKKLNADGNEMWQTYRHCLRRFLGSGTLSSSPRTKLTEGLERGLFANLIMERKIELCGLLLDLSTEDSDVHAVCTTLLTKVLIEPALIVQLLNTLQPDSGNGPRASKRPRLLTEPAQETLPRLSILAEVLATTSLPGSFDVIAAMVQALSSIIQSSSSDNVDISFVEQSMMSAIDNVADKVTEAPNVAPSAIRLEVLVDLIRTAQNPQTFQQALLLMATLARLTPDSVLHNIMPVFTFMGSNVFHRDDTYSFTVVQKTIDSIVPVMVSSLKRSHSSRMDLHLGSREFLRVFTDAANHIPRHRRTNFFIHLVDVLGPTDYLGPVCLLLIEKAANRVIRQSPDEARSTFALPLSLLHHYPSVLQLNILTEMLEESHRLASRAKDPENLEPSFLDDNFHEEHSVSPTTAFRRRAQAILAFVGFAAKSTPGSSASINTFVSLLVLMATLPSGQGSDTRMEDVNKASRLSLAQALKVMSAVDFLNSVIAMLGSSEQTVQVGALDLIAERVPMVSDSIRRKSTAAIVKIIERMKDLLIAFPTGPIAVSGLKALKSVGANICSGEEAAITQVLPVLVSDIRGSRNTIHAMSALSPLAAKLGPRIIPFFREIVDLCVGILRDGTEDLMTVTTEVLHGLLTSIPSFWGSGELTQVIKLYIFTSKGARNASLTSFVKTLTKKAPEKVLVPTLTQIWASLLPSPSIDQYDALFDIVKKSLRVASKGVIQDNLRALFNTFLEAFGALSYSDLSSTPVVPAFLELIVKINENTFRPLFRRLYDWAFVTAAADDATRKVTFCHVYSSLLDYFKGLMCPYMSFLIQPSIELLKGFTTSSHDGALWSAVLETLTKSMNYDDGVFWRDDKIRHLSPHLISQVPVCLKLNLPEGKRLLQDALCALTDNATDDVLLKSINLDLLMHTRSEDVQVRLYALVCSKTLWQTHGGKLLGFVAETSTFIAECSEDENDMVARESLNLKNAVESVAGNINGL